MEPHDITTQRGLSIAVVATLVLPVSLFAASAGATGSSAPDLRVALLEVLGTVESFESRFRVTIENVGNESAPSSVARVIVDGATFDEIEIPPLAPGGSTSATTLRWNATAGNHTATAIADAWGEVSEPNEANNARSIPFHVDPHLPDLALGEIDVSPFDASEGDNVTVSLIVENAGTLAAAGSTVEFAFGPASARVPVPPLAAGESAFVQATFIALSHGNTTVSAAADPEDAIGEVREGNNAARFTVTVLPPRPDLAVSIVSIVRARLDAGVATLDPGVASPRTITLRACNEGGSFPDGWTLDLQLAARAGTLASSRRLALWGFPPLAPGACEERQHTWNGLGAVGRISLIARASIVEHEAVESNNADARSIYVGPPVTGYGYVAPASPTGPLPIPYLPPP